MILSSFGLRNLPESEEFPFNLDLIKNFEGISFKQSVSFFVGENGTGKSTLMEALAYALNVPTVGSVPLDDDPLMEPARRLGKMLSLRYNERSTAGFFVRAEDFHGFVKNILRSIAELDMEIEDIKANWTGGDINLALGPVKAERKEYTDRYTEDFSAMSHGEGFLRFFNHRITGKGIYLIDEPEAALSPSRQLALVKIIRDAVQTRGSQFIIATHSPVIMAMPDSEVFHFGESKIKPVYYNETPHFQLSKAFMTDPERFFDALD